MSKSKALCNWSDNDLIDLRDLLASGRNKGARWMAFSVSEHYQKIAPLTKTEFLLQDGIERIFRDAGDLHGATVSPEILRDCLRRGWVYEWNKPSAAATSSNKMTDQERSPGSAFTLIIIALAGLSFGALLAEEQPKTLFMQKDTYSAGEFRSTEEKLLYLSVLEIPSRENSKNVDGYKQLVRLNPQKLHYQTKLDFYVKRKNAERIEAEATRIITQSKVSSSSRITESDAKSKCQARIMVEESTVTAICSTRSCISREVEERFGRCMLGYGYGRL